MRVPENIQVWNRQKNKATSRRKNADKRDCAAPGYGERKKKTTVTLKQDEIKKYFPPEYDEQKIRTVICQLWRNGAIRIIDKYEGRDVS